VQTPSRLYLILDYIAGGELFHQLPLSDGVCGCCAVIPFSQREKLIIMILLFIISSEIYFKEVLSLWSAKSSIRNILEVTTIP